jgi:hypothetical protein
MESEDPAEALYRALVGYVCDKLDVPEAGMTSDDIQQMLQAKLVDADIVDDFTKILKSSERARYAGSVLSDDEVKALVHGAAKQIDDLEVALKEDAT